MGKENMKKNSKRLKRERKTISIMIKLYCRHFHDKNESQCEECSDLFEYANTRLDSCIFGENKPVCSKCPIHCYKPDLREKIRKVMRYSGPKMIYTHFILGIRHLFDRFRKIENIPKSK